MRETGLETRQTVRGMRATLAVLALMASLLSMFVLSDTAAAHDGKYATNATSGNDSGTATLHDYKWATNGCTVVPDSVRGLFYFNHACDHHDGCYGNHWEWRSTCDARFWWNMEASCVYNWSWWNPARAGCRVVRDTYYSGVRALGYVAYNGWSISGPSGW